MNNGELALDGGMTLSNNSLSVNNLFKNPLDSAKNKTTSMLKSKVQEEKMKLIRAELTNKKIVFDVNIDNVSELKKSLKKNLSEIGYQNAEKVIDDITEKVDSLINELEKGSVTGVNKFVASASKVGSALTKTAGFGLASRTALLLAPTVVSKLAVSGVLSARAVYKLYKSEKSGKILSEVNECERILEELEITKEGDIVVDTRFSSEVQDTIRNFLNDKQVSFEDTGYLSLRNAITALPLDEKKELCNLLNTQLARGIDVNGRIESKRENFFSKVKDYGGTVLKTAGVVVGAAGVVNSVDPALLAGPLNGTTLGILVQELCENGFLSGICGLLGGVGTEVLENLPFVGEHFENIFAIENLVAAGIVGTAVGVAGVAGKEIVNAAKSCYHRFDNIKEKKKINKYDQEKYAEENKLEIEKMKEAIKRHEGTIEEDTFLDMLYQYFCEELNIKLEHRPKNIFEFSSMIEKLEDTDRNKIYHSLEHVKNYNRDHTNDFVNGLKKAANVAGGAVVLGLSGLSIYDIIKGGTFLPELSAKLFHDVSDNVYLMSEKPEISKIDAAGTVTQSGDVSMVADLDSARCNYQTVTNMTKEVTVSDKIISDMHENAEVVVNDIESGVSNVLEDPIGSVQDAINGIGDFFNRIGDIFTHPKETVDEIVDGVSNFAGDIVENLTPDTVNNTYIVPDSTKIDKFITDLNEEELVDLAYYFNNSKVANNDVILTSLGNALQSRIGDIQKFIDAHNQHVNFSRGASSLLNKLGILFGVTSQASAELNEMFEKKVISDKLDKDMNSDSAEILTI